MDPEDLSARILLKHILVTELPRTPITRSATKASTSSGIARSKKDAGAQTPQNILRRSMRNNIRESIIRKSLPATTRRKTSTPAPASMLFDDEFTPRHILKNILLTEPVKSPVVHEAAASEEPRLPSASSSIARKRSSTELSGLDLPELTISNAASAAKGLRRKRPRRSFNVTAFEKRLGDDVEAEHEQSSVEQSSLSLSSSTSLNLKTPSVGVHTEKRGLQRRVSNRRKISEEEFGAAVINRRVGESSVGPVEHGFSETAYTDGFTLQLSKLSEPDITNDIVNCNTALFAQSDVIPSDSVVVATQDKPTVMASQLQREMMEMEEEKSQVLKETSVNAFPSKDMVVAEHENPECFLQDDDDATGPQSEDRESTTDDQPKDTAATSESEEGVLDTQGMSKSVKVEDMETREESPQTEEDPETMSHSEEEEFVAVESQTEEENGGDGFQSEEDNTAVSQSDSEGKEAIPDSEAEEKDAIPDSEAEEKEAISDSEAEEKDSIPDSEAEEKDAIPDSEAEEKDAIPDSEAEEKEAIPDSEAEEKEAISDSEAEEKDSIPDSEAEEKDAIPDSEAEEKEAISDSEAEEKDSIPDSEAEEKEAIPDSEAEDDDAAKSPTGEHGAVDFQEVAETTPQPDEEEDVGESQTKEENDGKRQEEDGEHFSEHLDHSLEHISRRAYHSEGTGAVLADATETGWSDKSKAHSAVDPHYLEVRSQHSFQPQTEIPDLADASTHGQKYATFTAPESDQESVGNQEVMHDNDNSGHLSDASPVEADEQEEEWEDVEAEEFPCKTPAFVRQKRNFLPTDPVPHNPLNVLVSGTSEELTAAKPKQARQRRKGPAKKEPGLSKSYLMGVFKHFAKTKVSADVFPVLKETMNTFFDRLAEDLETYAHHAKRNTIEFEDAVLLLKRQGYVNDRVPVEALIEKYLRMDQRRLLIPIAKSGNVVSPKKR